MNKEDIKKALGYCSNTQCPRSEKCPYNAEFDCADILCKDALNLITEQEKEIEQLKAENVRLTTKLGQVLLSIDTVKEMNAMCDIEEHVKQAKIDVLKKLKEKRTTVFIDIDEVDEAVFIDDINELIKDVKE